MNVLIVNGYSGRNRGDGMIVSQMIRLFRERDCDVRLMSDDPADAARYDVPWAAPLVHTWPDDPRRPKRPRMFAQIARRWVHPPVGHPDLEWADVCVSAGGGYLYDDGSRTSRLNLALRLLPLRAARRAGVPVVLFSQSVGPFASSLWASQVGRALRRVDLVIVREELSVAVCRDLGVERLELCDDVAFALRPQNSVLPADPRQRGDRIVGVTVMNSLPGIGAAGYRAYRRALRDGLAKAFAGRDEHVVVVSQVAAHSGDNDIDAATGLTEELRRAGVRARFVDLGDESDAGLSAFYGRLDLVVASRLHSGILAMCASTPVVALSYLPKTDGVLARVGMPDLVLPAGDLDPTALAGTVRHALEGSDELRARVAQRLPGLRASAERAVDLALDVAR